MDRWFTDLPLANKNWQESKDDAHSERYMHRFNCRSHRGEDWPCDCKLSR